MAVYMAALKPGDTILSLELSHGGHLTHGLKVNFSGRLYTIVHYGVSRETNMVDYDDVLQLAKEHRPKLIVCGGSAYPRTVEADRFREIADEVGRAPALRHGPLRRAGRGRAAPRTPCPHCDFVTSTTHKTLAGPRAGFILCREEHAQAVDRAVFPGMQGGPLEHTIAAKATCFKIAATEAFRDYQQQVRANADALSAVTDRRGSRRSHRRHRHPPAPARPRADELDGQGRRGAPGRGQADGQPQHRPVRRATADDRLRRADRDAGGDDARASTTRTSARSGRSSSRRSATARPVGARGPGGGALRQAPALPGLPRLHHLPRVTAVATGQ